MNHSVAYDQRDREVLRELDRRGIEEVDVVLLRKIYQTVTDIKRQHTIKRRIECLTSTDDFEPIDFGRWRWNGRTS